MQILAIEIQEHLACNMGSSDVLVGLIVNKSSSWMSTYLLNDFVKGCHLSGTNNEEGYHDGPYGKNHRSKGT